MVELVFDFVMFGYMLLLYHSVYNSLLWLCLINNVTCADAVSFGQRINYSGQAILRISILMII